MLEKVGNKDIIVRNYTDNFNIKEYIQEVLIPKAFPDIPMNKLNLGFTGVVSEYISQGIEDAHGTASLMMNESFITKAVLPSSIYGHASLFDLGYIFATPSKCSFAIQLNLTDVIKNSSAVQNTNTMRYILDKDTKIILGDNTYKLDYDIFIDHSMVNNKRVFNIYYDMTETNSVSRVTNKYIKHQVSTIDWLVLFIDLLEFERKTDEESITDNLLTTNSEIFIRWTRQLAGLDLVYISPTGQRIPMKLKTQYTKADVEPFAWYRMVDDNTIALSFSNNDGYWSPDFNSKVEYTVYMCSGASSNFTSYDSRSGLPVKKTGERYPYNTDTTMVAICYSGSTGGIDRGTIEDVRDESILAHNTVNVLTTDTDLDIWFNRYAKRYGTKAKFFKRRDDPSGTLFAQFIAIMNNTYIYPTNTLNIRVNQDQFDYVNSDASGMNSEFIIKPGHLWEYDDTEEDGIVRNRLRMVEGTNGMAMITDEAIPSINTNRPFMFVNPFFIKIHRYPTTSMSYNYLINHTSWPEDEPINTQSFYQFQMAQFTIERTLSAKHNNMYHIEVICVPVVTTDKTMKYVEGIGEEFPINQNKLRVVLITKTAADGETGYIEMVPTELRNGGAILFETDIAVYDNINSDMMLEVDMERTPNIHSLITNGSREGKVFIDSAESSFHFAVMMKDTSITNTSRLFNDPSYDGYTMTNRFRNAHRDLTLYKPMNMMRSMIEFSGENNNYTIDVSMLPFLRYDIPLDDEKMTYFIQAFEAQYKAMEPVTSKLDGNSFIDFKLYNTYGRSNNYYIGPKDGEVHLKNSDILLDNVYVKVRLVISVYDRSIYTQTVNEVINQITETFNNLNTSSLDLHASDIISDIIKNNPNVRYLRFLGFNDYDANKQSIFVKYSDISELNENQLQTNVPEIIRVDESSISISEET